MTDAPAGRGRAAAGARERCARALHQRAATLPAALAVEVPGPAAARSRCRPHRGHAAAGQRGPQRGLARDGTRWGRGLAASARAGPGPGPGPRPGCPGVVQLAAGAVRQRAARLHRRPPHATHRHYDEVLGLHGRHMGEIDERHLILQEELVTHVHDLVQADRPRAGGGGARAAGPGARSARRARPGAAARGAARREMKTVLVCAAQAPFVTGGAEILVSELRANLERRGFRADVAAVPFKWYPVSETGAPGPGLAAARRDGEQAASAWTSSSRPSSRASSSVTRARWPGSSTSTARPTTSSARPIAPSRTRRRTSRSAAPSRPWTPRP